jgi:glycosyltransferase involved in cell wall biosynthesis
MNIKAYPLNGNPAILQLASRERTWLRENEYTSAHLGCGIANRQGWNVLCPCAFEATWNGGPKIEDIEIQVDRLEDGVPAFVQSQLGGGVLTLHTGYQIKPDSAYRLWIRGPINEPKDGIYPLESIADTSVLPCTISMHWKFTRPHQTVRFEAGEAFCALVPFPGYDFDNLGVEVIQIGEDVERYERDLQEIAANPAFHGLLPGLGTTIAKSTEAPSNTSVWASRLHNPPPVSCICPAYGRVDLLEEAIYGFLQQDYPGEKELIVLNDRGEQTLACDHPEVHIINLPGRFHSIGEKFNALAGLALHDLILVWPEDAISLPHRISFTVSQLEPKQGFFNAQAAWILTGGQLSSFEYKAFHGASLWTRDLFAKVRGYPHVGDGYDTAFEQLCQEYAPESVCVRPTTPENAYYIHREPSNGSEHPNSLGQNEQPGQGVADSVQEQAALECFRHGQIQLKPHWSADYVGLVRDSLARRTVAGLFPPLFHRIPPPAITPARTQAAVFKGHYPAKISVILPACNEAVLLKRTVEQFSATLPPNSEIIVVDNGSTDGCSNFLEQREYKGVHLVRAPEPLGVSGARNRGLAQAQGEVVVFADAHIDIPERWWQPIVALLNDPRVGVVGPAIGVMGDPEYPKGYGQRIADSKLRVEWLGYKSEEPYPVPTLGGGFMAMHHDTLKQAGAFDADMSQWGSEDLELCVRYWLLGFEAWVVPDLIVLHYFRSKNPYKVEWRSLTHNLLRVALLHLSEMRLARVLGALKSDPHFEITLAAVADSRLWQQRAYFADRRVHDDDWYFEKFKDSCPV